MCWLGIDSTNPEPVSEFRQASDEPVHLCYKLQSDGLHMTGCSNIFMLLFSPNTNRYSKQTEDTSKLSQPLQMAVVFSESTVHLPWRANIRQTGGSLSRFKYNVAFLRCHFSFDASVPVVTVKAHSVTLPSIVFKAKHKSFHTDTCQLHRCISRMFAVEELWAQQV